MNIKEFYTSLGNWIDAVNQASQTMNQEDYWNYVLVAAGELSKQYGEHQLVKDVINVHIDFLEKAFKGAGAIEENN